MVATARCIRLFSDRCGWLSAESAGNAADPLESAAARGYLRARVRDRTEAIASVRAHTAWMAHRFAEHVGEVELELEAASEAGIFESALAAFAELVGPDKGGEPFERVVELTAGDRALLLADWLSELVFLAEVEEFVPDRVEAIDLLDGCLRATVVGCRANPRHLVKAVTLNRLEFEPEGGTWHGRVVLDV
jgi:SHS2 domain-containing protein